MSDGILLDAADALVAAIQAKIDNAEFPGTVAWQDDPYFELEKAKTTPETWVVDFGITQQTNHQSITLVEFVLAVIVRQKLSTGESQKAECRAASKFTADLETFCRNLELSVGDNAAVCFKTDRTPARSHEMLQRDGLYLAEITTHWRMVTDFEDSEDNDE
jgi:hypothetical protein